MLLQSCLFLFIRVCPKEETNLCFKGANKIVRKLVKESIMASALFKASVQLFLTILDKYQPPDDQKFLKTGMEELSRLIFQWMEKVHGQNLLLTETKLELYVRNVINKYFHSSFCRIGVIYFYFPSKISLQHAIQCYLSV